MVSSRTDIIVVVSLSRTASAAALASVPDIIVVVSSRTDLDDDVVDIIVRGASRS